MVCAGTRRRWYGWSAWASCVLLAACAQSDPSAVLRRLVATREVQDGGAPWGEWGPCIFESVHGGVYSIEVVECGQRLITEDGELLPPLVRVAAAGPSSVGHVESRELEYWWREAAYVDVRDEMKPVYASVARDGSNLGTLDPEVARSVVEVELARTWISSMDYWRSWRNISDQLDLLYVLAESLHVAGDVMESVRHARRQVAVTLDLEAKWRSGAIKGELECRVVSMVGMGGVAMVRYPSVDEIARCEGMAGYVWRDGDRQALERFWHSEAVTRWVRTDSDIGASCVTLGEVCRLAASAIMGKKEAVSLDEFLSWADNK